MWREQCNDKGNGNEVEQVSILFASRVKNDILSADYMDVNGKIDDQIQIYRCGKFNEVQKSLTTAIKSFK